MNERQIKRIRKKFILLSTLSFFGVMLLMGGMIYLFSTAALRNEVRHIMQFIVENDGELPEISGGAEQTAENETASAHEQESADGGTLPGTAQEDVSEDVRIEWSLRGIFGVSGLWGESPDYLYTIRYFAVLFDENENVVYTTMIPVGTSTLVLPSYLSGNYRIEIIPGAIYFWGNIEV